MLNNKKLLKLLQEDARLSNSQLASMLAVSEAEVATAIATLEKTGLIKGYRAVVNWEKSEDSLASALIEVRVTPQRDTGFDEIAKQIMAFSQVESVYLMSGGYDLAVMVTAATMAEVAMFVSKRLAPMGGILSTATHFVLTRYKDGNTVFCSDSDQIDERGSNLCD